MAPARSRRCCCPWRRPKHQDSRTAGRDAADEEDTEEEEPELSAQAAAEKWGEYWKHFQWPVDESLERSCHHSEHHLRERGCSNSCCMCCCRRRDTDSEKQHMPLDKTANEYSDELKLWDVDDPALMEKVVCNMLVKVTAVDAKNSCYELRLKCKWKFRTLHSDQRTETKLRVPGIRLPGLIVAVDESRIWKDMEGTKRSNNTVLWRGMSRFTITGFERFELGHFPYDRQIISLDIFDFVWRSPSSTADNFDFSMQVVLLHVETATVLPEWQEYPAIIRATGPKQVAFRRTNPTDLPAEYASRFMVKLRLERRTWFYILQAFGLTVLITISSIVPLCMPLDSVADRLSIYASGMLTLTSFKYTIADHLPSVPYSNYMDWVMFWELVCLMFAAAESVIIYRFILDKADDPQEQENSRQQARVIEDAFFCVILFTWVGVWLYLAGDAIGMPFGKRPSEWPLVLEDQEFQADFDELEDLAGKSQKTSLKQIIRQLDQVHKHINEVSYSITHADDTGEDVVALSVKLKRLQEKQSNLEQEFKEATERAQAAQEHHGNPSLMGGS